MSALSAKAGKGMAGIRAGVSGNPTLLEEVTGCAGAMVGMVEALEGTRKNQKVILRMGASDDLLFVSCAWAVAVGDCVAVAPVGSVVGDVAVTTPILLDEVQLGWANGSPNSTVRLNAFDLLPGDSVPSERPERKKAAKAVDAMGNEIEEETTEALFATKVKLTKEEKTAAKAEKAKAKAIKNGTWVEPEPDAEDVELRKASKKEIKEAKARAKQRREAEADEGISTEIELELAGLCLE
jgi:hypothetical protein